MSNKVKTAGTLFIGAILGTVLTVVATMFLFQPMQSMQEQSSGSGEKKPLHWVAPMDPNYKRDKPGKSPMGMDLIPIYEEGNGEAERSPGTIRVSPDVVNNLGVRTAVAQRKALHAEIKTVGYVRYDEDNLVHIHPRVQGWIEKLFVKASGDPVKKGQPLYQIYSPELVNAQEEFVLAIRRKNQRLIQASEDRLRALQLPRSVIKRLKENQKVSQAITFYAPQNGVVDNLNIREGFYVQPGTTLMSIGALDPIWVEAEVFERQASLVSTGLPVTMSMDYRPGEQWEGKVDYIYPTLDQKTRTVKVRLRFNNENGVLKPNMFTQVVIHSRSTPDILLVPKESVIRTGNSDRVVIARGEGQFKSIEVKVGRLDDQFAEILDGLDDGDKVVTSAQFLLDSESSKTSDFKRMYHEDKSTVSSPMVQETTPDSENSAEVDGVINTIMAEHRMLNISRGPVPKWNKSEATMDFLVDEQVDLSSLQKGMKVHFRFMVDAGKFVVTEIMPQSAEGTTEHGQHQESGHD